uniref:Uncharacterized protein n=1 Tax=Cacopsylla melanoneura TaxID=428564 RepID=A0A8D8WT88_9HEMI
MHDLTMFPSSISSRVTLHIVFNIPRLDNVLIYSSEFVVSSKVLMFISPIINNSFLSISLCVIQFFNSFINSLMFIFGGLYIAFIIMFLFSSIISIFSAVLNFILYVCVDGILSLT